MLNIGDRVKIISIDSEEEGIFYNRIGIIDRVNSNDLYCYHLNFCDYELNAKGEFYWWSKENVTSTDEGEELSSSYLDYTEMDAENKKLKKEKFPDFWQSILMLLGLFGIQIVVLIFADLIANLTGIRYLNNEANKTIIVMIISYIILIVIVNKKTDNSIRKRYKGPKSSKKSVLYSLLLITSWWFVVLPVTMLLLNSSNTLMESGQEIAKTLSDMSSVWSGVFYMILFAPFFEEIIFRGIILKGLLNNYGVKKSVFISALIFGIMHFNLVQSSTAFATGIILGVIYVKTGSLKVCFFIHAINNTFVGIMGGIINENNIYIVLSMGIIFFTIIAALMYKLPNNFQNNEESIKFDKKLQI